MRAFPLSSQAGVHREIEGVHSFDCVDIRPHRCPCNLADGDTVLVSGGVCDTGGRAIVGLMTNRVVIDKAIRVESLTNGRTRTSGDYPKETSGVGAWCESSGVPTHCTLTGNSAPYGGGGGAYGGTLYNCTLSGNSAGLEGEPFQPHNGEPNDRSLRFSFDVVLPTIAANADASD